jgi:putative transposase
MDRLTPKDHAEAVALFRSEIVGALVRRELDRGELRALLHALSQERFRPPGSPRTRSFSVPTLERWYYACRQGGLAALRPRPRSDRGRAQELTPAQRALLCDIRREHPSASVPLILRTLVADGRLQAGAVSPATVRRLFVEHGLDRVPLRDGAGAHTRLQWQAERPMVLWHGDVCHGPTLLVGCQRKPLRIHALLDDASRCIVAIEAHHTELEADMLRVLVGALRRHGLPGTLYLDNGSTYSGELLRLCCARLGIALVHARPHDPRARGKMERVWRTLREGCLDHLGPVAALVDVNARLHAFVTEHYQQAPHAGLMGKSPQTVWDAAAASRPADTLDETKLFDALTLRARRRVRRDCTVSVDGAEWELDQGFLAGRVVTVGRSYLDPASAPWVEYEGKPLVLHLVDPVRNSRRKRPPRRPPPDAVTGAQPPVPFDPIGALLTRARDQEPKP